GEIFLLTRSQLAQVFFFRSFCSVFQYLRVPSGSRIRSFVGTSVLRLLQNFVLFACLFQLAVDQRLKFLKFFLGVSLLVLRRGSRLGWLVGNWSLVWHLEKVELRR